MEQNTVDRSNLRRVILESPRQLYDGFVLAQDVRYPGVFGTLVLHGMGGSALPANLLRMFLYHRENNHRVPKPVAIYQNRFYHLQPEAYTPGTLNVFCSFSGNTEETISALNEAIDAKLAIIGVSHGGKIQEICQKHNIPHVQLPYPYENFQPRMATGYFFTVLVQLCVNHGIISPDCIPAITDTVQTLDTRVVAAEEQGKDLAKKLVGSTPIIYTDTTYKSLGMVWKIKINENAKTPAFYNNFPELNHNEMVGFTNPQGTFTFLLLCDKNGHQRTQKRFDVFTELFTKRGNHVYIIPITGRTIVEKIFSTIALADWTSYYLAIAYNQDPTPVDMVEEFKEALKK